MKVCAVHTKVSGSTRKISDLLIEELKKNNAEISIQEYTVAGFKPCAGCFSCFANGEKTCPHASEVGPIAAAIEEADVVILDSPCYTMGMAGAMQSFLEHLGYRFFAHRPHPAMAHKIGVAISTCGGLGAGKVTKDLKRHFFYWGAAKYYRLPFTVFASSWPEVKEKTKAKIVKKIQKTALSISEKSGEVNRPVHLRMMMRVCGAMVKKGNGFPLDAAWWTSQNP